MSKKSPKLNKETNMGHINTESDTPVVQPTEVVSNLNRGRKAGTKVENIVPAAEFVAKYPGLVKEGKSIQEIATFFKLKPATIIQKRLAYNKQSAEAGHPLNLPLPASTGSRGAKKIDWAAMAQRVQASVNA